MKYLFLLTVLTVTLTLLPESVSAFWKGDTKSGDNSNNNNKGGGEVKDNNNNNNNNNKSSEPVVPCQSYLDLTDEQLFAAATNGNVIGDYCRVKNAPNSACEYYVHAKPSDLTNYDGWPRTYDDRGRGCVYHPEGKGKCLFLRDDYRHWAMEDRTQMCAGTVVQNAAAQLRHAIVNDACGGECSLPECHLSNKRPYCYHCRKCKQNLENCAEGYKFCKLCREECPQDYEKGEIDGAMGDEL